MIKFKYIKSMKKSKTRLFIEKKLSLNMMIVIKDKQHHFLKNVLRCKIGDEISLFDSQTGEWKSRINLINRDNTVLQILKKHRDLKKESDIWLIFSPIKQHRLNIILQKATELGVSKIIPCITNYTDNNFLNFKSLNLNIIEAAEQCNRLTIPILEKKITLDKFLSQYPNDRALIFCNEKYDSNESMYSSIVKIKNNFSKWTLLVGPEGGFSEEEITKINKISNIISISLGKRILRSDTAITAALFCLQSILESSN